MFQLPSGKRYQKTAERSNHVFFGNSANFLWQLSIAIYVSLPEGSHVYHVYHGSLFFGYPIQDLWVCWSFRMEHPPVGESKIGKDNVGLLKQIKAWSQNIIKGSSMFSFKSALFHLIPLYSFYWDMLFGKSKYHTSRHVHWDLCSWSQGAGRQFVARGSFDIRVAQDRRIRIFG
jgi:hypothetical protein